MHGLKTQAGRRTPLTRNRRRREPKLRRACAALLVLALSGCNYSFRAGAGLPEYVRTIAIIPFENETNRFELTQMVHDELIRAIPRALGLSLAGEEAADAVLAGSIRSYDLVAPSYRQGSTRGSLEVTQRQVGITLSVEIVDQIENVILWDNSSLRAQGQYLNASETEEVGRNKAIEILVHEIVDGIQSNW